MTGAYQFLRKYGVAISFGVGALLVAIMYIIIASGLPEIAPTQEEQYDMSSFDFGLYVTYVLIAVACLAVVLFSLVYVIKNPKESIKGLIGFGILVALFGITYAMGDGYLTPELVKSDPSFLPTEVKTIDGTQVTVPVVLEEGVTQSPDLQLADGLIKYGYIMLILASAIMVLAMLRDLFKK